MPALDQCHFPVVHALQKEGWIVNPHPQHFRVKRRAIFIDIFATQSTRRIYVEAKCFADPFDVDEQYHAIGQCRFYQAVLDAVHDPTPLYLAIPGRMDNKVDEIMRRVLHTENIKYIVFDEVQEVIQQWNE
jgi:hypothetical protein